MTELDERTQLLDDLESLVLWLREHPDFEVPYGLRGAHTVYVTKDELMTERKKLDGKLDKVFTSWDIGFEKHFGTTSIRLVTGRDAVCEKVQVGTRVVPAQEAVEEHEEPIYEWVCPDSVLSELAND